MSIFDKITERVGDIVDEVMLPEPVRRAHEMAAAAIESNDYSVAIRLLSQTLADHPNVARTHFLIGKAHFHDGAFQAAIDAFERASEIRESANALFYAGLAFEQLRKFRDAQRYFARASTLGPTTAFDFDLEYARGRVSRALGRVQKSLRHFRRALDSASDDSAAVDALRAEFADALCDVQQFDHATEVLDSITTESALPLIVSARIATERGETGRVRAIWQKALRYDEPKYRGRALVGSVEASVRAGDYHSAALELDQIPTDILSDEERSRVDYYRGRTFEASGQFDVAAAALDASLAKEPLAGDVLLARGRVGLARNEPNSDEYFSRVLEQFGELFAHDAYFGLGQFYEKRDEFLTARQMYEEAQRHNGELTREISTAMGELSLRLGDLPQAVLDFRAAEAFDSEEDALAKLRFHWSLPAKVETPDDIHHVLRTLGKFLSADPGLSTFVDAYQETTELMSTPLSVAVLGEFNAGKSTVVNALIGEDVTPVGVVPTTAQQSVLQYGPRKSARVVMVDDRSEEMTFEDARKLMKSNSDDIERIEFTYPHPQLRVVNFWDTPGFNALHERHEQVARRALQTAEAILWVMDSNQVLSQSQLDQIEEIRRSADRLIVLINKADRVDEAQLEHLIGYVREHLGDAILGVFGVSAKNARESGDPGFDTFREFFEREIVQRAGRLKTLEATQRLGVLSTVLSAFQNGAVQRTERLSATLAETTQWISVMQAEKAKQWARVEVETLTDWSALSLQAIESEIADSLKPVGSWTGKLALREDDREYLVGMVESRLDQILRRSFQRVVRELARFEAQLSERVTTLLQQLPLTAARAVSLRFESYFDETRKLKVLLDERIYGRLQAEGRGKMHAGGDRAFMAIESAQGDRASWRPTLRTLIPDFADVQTIFEAWFIEFFGTTLEFCGRLQSELDLLYLDSEYRLDVAPFVQLFESGPKTPEGE